MNFKNIINKLRESNYSISTMESCTGGGVSNAITNCSGASDVFYYGAVTYSNQFKIKMGVDSNIIDKYSVYSLECAKSMSKAISNFTNSTFGVGVTGKINRVDINNLYGEDNVVFISIYNKIKDSYRTSKIICVDGTRRKNKSLIINEVIKLIEEEL